MRRELLAATALTTGIAGTFWADLSFAQSDVHDWGGIYVGGAAGASFQNSVDLELPAPDGSTGVFVNGALQFPDKPSDLTLTPWQTNFDLDDARFSAGGEVGFNVQHGRFIFGIESDLFWLGDRQKGTFHALDTAPSGGSGASEEATVTAFGGVDTLVTLRPKVGIAATDRLLIFGTGGLAIGGASVGSSADIDALYTDHAKSADYFGQNSETMTGFAVGGGAEYAVTKNLSLKLEGLHYDLGTLGATIEGTGQRTDFGPPPVTASRSVESYHASMDMSGNVARLGVTLTFK